MKNTSSKYFTHTLELLSNNSMRECHIEECTQRASFVTGFYLVNNTRRVRVWSCLNHWSGVPSQVMLTPASIVAAENAEKIHYENMRKHYTQDVAPEERVSVKTLASSGHGTPVLTDKIKAWRWGGY